MKKDTLCMKILKVVENMFKVSNNRNEKGENEEASENSQVLKKTKIEDILQIPKIVQMKVTKVQLIAAINKSNLLTYDNLNDSIAIFYDSKIKSKLKSETKQKLNPKPIHKSNIENEIEMKQKRSTAEEDIKEELEIKENETLNPVIYSIEAMEGERVSWKDIESCLLSEFPQNKLLYVRFENNKGFAAFTTTTILDKTNLKLKNEEIKLAPLSSKEKKEFWKLYGKHMQNCISKKLRFLSKN